MKVVKFNLDCNEVYTTYSISEYDRSPIDYVLYLKYYNKISDKKWNEMLVELNSYKSTEMVVHKSSICNTKLHL